MVSASVYDAIVVGSGPNGLAAAITLSRAGRSVLLIEAKDTVGGGMRSAPLTLPGFTHDVCSAVHPMAVASPFFASLDLGSHGVEWVHPPAPLAHPLDAGKAAVLERSLEATADSLGPDRTSYLRLMRPFVDGWHDLSTDLLGPLRIPANPVLFARFGLKALRSIEQLEKRVFRGAAARAMFSGIAAHSIMPTWKAGSAAYGLVLGAAGHAVGWPIVRGGSQNLARAMTECFAAAGGNLVTGNEVRSLDDLPASRSVLFDLTPRQVAKIAGSRLPDRYRRLLLNYPYGPGVFKMDWALSGPIPWESPSCARAATVHVGGTSDEVAEAENAVWRGVHPERPFIIVGQPSLFDPGLAPSGKHTAWAYCHVPNGSTEDMSGRIEAQIERYAPGFGDRILARHSVNTIDMEEYNANCVGGDIAGGRQGSFRSLARPLGRWRPYATPSRGLYLCSSSTPPGAGVHGMCGYHAARRAMSDGF
jgi:phytoene dehydrogenase-like protein